MKDMMRRIGLAVAVLGLAAGVAAQARAGIVLNNGQLSVDIRTDNGAIDTVLFGGTDFYNPGISVTPTSASRSARTRGRPGSTARRAGGNKR